MVALKEVAKKTSIRGPQLCSYRCLSKSSFCDEGEFCIPSVFSKLQRPLARLIVHSKYCRAQAEAKEREHWPKEGYIASEQPAEPNTGAHTEPEKSHRRRVPPRGVDDGADKDERMQSRPRAIVKGQHQDADGKIRGVDSSLRSE